MKILLLAPFSATLVFAQGKSLQPRVREILDAISEQRIEASIQKLVSFGTRNTLSTRGVAEARQWILDEMKSYSPKLHVSFDTYQVVPQGRITRDVELRKRSVDLDSGGTAVQLLDFSRSYRE